MVREFAEFDVKPGTEQDFVAGVLACQEMFLSTPGCHGLELHRSVEQPQHFVLNIQWDSVAAHQAFRDGPDYARWRGTVGGFFAGTPNVWHGNKVV
jgi:quinol monooxygenase YgiN